MSRWTLNRAGIVNVYQYGDVTIPFRGGRLLLRGVNGSGKSTAMNMLLPFLLEADARRIDAAGEQTAVLRSWMLAGRDDPQPVGYLWLEVERPAEGAAHPEHLVFGCGIRANRSTDRVTTWWFITDRRPGIDLALVANRTPISRDALAAEIGHVYGHDQRAAYRTDLQRRLYGGAPLDQHLRLLHTVRSPRVGDRVDQDLPEYLADALPQLSEQALEDAAQPLEDLDEHRRNVENLARTGTALTALGSVYREYAATEVHDRLDCARATAADAAKAAAHADRLRAEVERADRDLVATHAGIDRTEAELRRLDEEVAALRASDAYRAGADLADLRGQVALAAGAVQRASEHLAAAKERAHAGARAVARAAEHADADSSSVAERLGELRSLAADARLIAAVPDAPAVVTTALDDHLVVPVAVPDAAPIDAALGLVRAAAQVRRDEVREVIALLAEVSRVEDLARRAAAALDDALTDEEDARALAHERRVQRDTIAGAHRNALLAWGDALRTHAVEHAMEVDLVAPPEPSVLIGARDTIAAGYRAAVDTVLAVHEGRVAVCDTVRRAREADALEAERVLDALLATDLPEVPPALWQVPGGAPRFAECVDFAEHLSPAERAGLEAALEASQLLPAEIDPTGSLVVDGQLLLRAAAPVARPLSSLLHQALPDGSAPDLHAAVAAVLASISVDPADFDVDGDATVVLVDGRFRSGATVGRHVKTEAEHVGVGARRATLERRRIEAAVALDAAHVALDLAQRALAEAVGARAAAEEVRQALPASTDLERAVLAVDQADDRVDRAVERTGLRREEARQADDALADVTARFTRRAASADLPRARDALDRIDHDLRSVASACTHVRDACTALLRSVGTWLERASDHRTALEAVATAVREHTSSVADHTSISARLATLEDAVGLEHEQVVASIAQCDEDRGTAAAQLAEARTTHAALLVRVGELRAVADRAIIDRDAAEARCAGEVDTMRQVLAVPGLAAALAARAAVPVEDDDASAGVPALTLPGVERSTRGLRTLVDAVAGAVPHPTSPTPAESVRQSLRQRRDALGAGWDAEDRQPDPTLPLHIEVTGPLGQFPLVAAAHEAGLQLRRAERLLTAQQDQALRNLLQGLIAREVAEKLLASRDLVARMNARLDAIRTTHGIGVSLRWKQADDLDPATVTLLELLARPADLRTIDDDQQLVGALAERITRARTEAPDVAYRQLIATVLDYRAWHRMTILLHRPGRDAERLTRRTALSEGEKKMVSYLPLFAAVAASCDALAEAAPDAPRFVLLDDAFAKVSEDNHPKLFGLLVELDLDVIATSERLWGTHDTVPSLAICEVIRDASLGVIALQHAEWDGETLQFTGHAG